MPAETAAEQETPTQSATPPEQPAAADIAPDRPAAEHSSPDQSVDGPGESEKEKPVEAGREAGQASRAQKPSSETPATAKGEAVEAGREAGQASRAQKKRAWRPVSIMVGAVVALILTMGNVAGLSRTYRLEADAVSIHTDYDEVQVSPAILRLHEALLQRDFAHQPENLDRLLASLRRTGRTNHYFSIRLRNRSSQPIHDMSLDLGKNLSPHAGMGVIARENGTATADAPIPHPVEIPATGHLPLGTLEGGKSVRVELWMPAFFSYLEHFTLRYRTEGTDTVRVLTFPQPANQPWLNGPALLRLLLAAGVVAMAFYLLRRSM